MTKTFSISLPSSVPEDRSTFSETEKIKNEIIFSRERGAIVDVALGTKGRLDDFKETLDNLNRQTLSAKFNVYIMNGDSSDEIAKYLRFKKYNFNGLYLYYDHNYVGFNGKWPKIYNELFSMGNSEWLTYWSDDILLKDDNAFERAIKESNGFPACIFYPRIRENRKEDLVRIRNIICINHGLIRRDIFRHYGGLDEGYNFHFADFDLSLDIQLKQKIKLVHSPIVHKSLPKENPSFIDDRRRFFENYLCKVKWGFKRELLRHFIDKKLIIYFELDEFSTYEAMSEIERVIQKIKTYFQEVKIIVNNKSQLEVLKIYNLDREQFSLFSSADKIFSMFNNEYDYKLSFRCGHSFKKHISTIMQSLYDSGNKPIYFN